MAVLPALLGLVVGMVIGGLGGGGGVLTVPVLVYLLGQSAQDATTSSVLIVGVTAAVGAAARVRAGLVRWSTGLGFAAAGIPAALAGTLLNQRTPPDVLLLTFAALTVLAAVAMLVDGGGRQASADDAFRPAAGDRGVADGGGRQALADASQPGTGDRGRAAARAATIAKVLSWGAAVGFLTGFLGVGGGFLLVPALVVVMGLPMHVAIGTSLLVIAINAAAAAIARAGGPAPDWSIVVPFTAAAVAGTVLGKRISDRLSGRTLTRAFAVMLLLVGAAVALEILLG